MIYGPKQEWEIELEKVSKSGLFWMTRSLMRWMWTDPKELLESAKNARRMGKRLDLTARINRLLEDPAGYTRASMRKSDAAKKAARRRKREARSRKGAAK
jgi:hypothetical protein